MRLPLRRTCVWTRAAASAVLVLAAGCLLAALAGCESGDGAPTPTGGTSATTYQGSGPIRIVATVAMVADIVREVAGERADVIGLMGEGVDPHLYKPTREDIRRLTEADMVFYSGLSLEGRMTDAFARAARGGKPVFAVTEKLDEEFLREPPEFAGHYDPHVWMDVTGWSQCVEVVAEALVEFDPQYADDYRRRATAYREKLAALHAYAARAIASIPEGQRVLVTAHDAFGYFSRAYNIPVRSVQGISTESEAGVDDVNRLVDFIVERKIPALFVESSVNPSSLKAVIAGAASRGHTVTIGGELYSDAMGPAGTYEGTYIGMLDHNATIIARALGGDAPEKGLNGRLK